MGCPPTLPHRRLSSSGHVWFADRRFGNVADHVGDDAARVAANRRRLAAEVAREAPWVPPDADRWIWLRQVHGATVVAATAASTRGEEADGVVTTVPSLPLAIVTADCVPIALANRDAVAAVHAGWRGLAAGVVGRAVEVLRGDGGGGGEITAVLGPSIGPCHYAFAAVERDGLVERYGSAIASTTEGGEPALDLPAFARVVLEAAGVSEIDDGLCRCTFHHDTYFSHRRGDATGRQAMVVAREP